MFVSRREDGSIDGVFANRQEGATEELAADHPDIVAFYAALNDPVPAIVSAGGLVRALYDTGRTAAVKTAVAAAGGLAEDLWLHAGQFERAHELVIQIAGDVGMSDQELDDLFRLAKTYG